MAKIWPVYEGNRPTIGSSWADLPLGEAVALFELRSEDFVSALEATPRFGPMDRDLTFTGFKHVVIEVDRNEARQTSWKPGFYKSKIKPAEAFKRLIRQALVSKLGKKNVVDVDWRPGVDSQGEQALKIRVVIAPDATEKLKNGVVLDALVALQQRLSDMRDARIPIVEYVTEAELRQDAGS
jgi:hypothetical protein